MGEGVDEGAGEGYDCGEEQGVEAEDLLVARGPEGEGDEAGGADADGDGSGHAAGDAEGAGEMGLAAAEDDEGYEFQD